MISDGTDCYWERMSGFGGTIGEIIANHFGAETQIVDIKPTDKGFHSSLCNLWINDLTPGVPTQRRLGFRRSPACRQRDRSGHLADSGMGDSCYWERLAGFGGGGIDTISSALTSGASIVRIAQPMLGSSHKRVAAPGRRSAEANPSPAWPGHGGTSRRV